MVKIISLKCPECGADISIEEGHKQCFCQYCGAKIILDDGNTTHTYHKVDEARIKYRISYNWINYIFTRSA